MSSRNRKFEISCCVQTIYNFKLNVPEIFAKVNSGHATQTGERVDVLLILVSLPLTSGLKAKIQCTAEQ